MAKTKSAKDLRKDMIRRLKKLEKYQKIEQVIAKESDKMAEIVQNFHEKVEVEKIKKSLKK